MMPQTIYIGHLGEANSRHYDIDISDLQAVASGCTPVLYVKRNGDTDAYPATTTLTGNVLRWTFTAVDTAKLGFGECQVVMCNSAGTIIAKSNLIRICCKQSLTTTSTVPDAWAPWVAQVSTLKAQIDAKGASIDSAVASGLASIATKKDEALDALGVKYGEIYQLATTALAAITLSGNENIDAVKAEGTTQKAAIDSKTAEFSTYLSEQKEDIVTSVTAAQTAKTQAEQAAAGVNKVNASVSKAGTVATITMTDKNGSTTTATITDGVNGTNGTNGVDGVDGADGDPGVYLQDDQPTQDGARVWLKGNSAQSVKVLTEGDIPAIAQAVAALLNT